MKNYEVMYIAKPMEDVVMEKLIEKLNCVLTSNGGIIEKIDRWGKLRFAYKIEGFHEGIYVLVTFSAEPGTVKELDRVMKITDEVLRHMIIRKGE